LFDKLYPNIFSTSAEKTTSSQTEIDESFTARFTNGTLILSQVRVIKYFEPVISSDETLTSLLSFINTTK
jgi:hypothetical protein